MLRVEQAHRFDPTPCAFSKYSTASRTAPDPPGRGVTNLATSMTSGDASRTAIGMAQRRKIGRSGRSSPTMAVSSAAMASSDSSRSNAAPFSLDPLITVRTPNSRRRWRSAMPSRPVMTANSRPSLAHMRIAAPSRTWKRFCS
jgi:hypothetical protein